MRSAAEACLPLGEWQSMGWFSYYKPLVNSLILSYSKDRQLYDDLFQEVMIKLLSFRGVLETEDYRSEYWSRKIYKSLENALIDEFRKLNRRKLKDIIPQEFLVDAPDSGSDVFQHSCLYFSLKEFSRFLPDLEMRILTEAVHPSESFRWFLRQRQVVSTVYNRLHDAKGKCSQLDLEMDPALAEYFGVTSEVFTDAVARIKTLAARILTP